MKTIGEKIAIARKSQNLSQTDVAGKVGITPQMVSKWERDESLPDVMMLKRLAEILEVSVAYFYDEAEIDIKADVKETAAEEKSEKRKSRAWLNEHKWFGNDFSGTSLKDMDFAYAKFTGCIMSGCQFAETSLSYTEFKACTLNDANFQKTKMFRADIEGSNLDGADFTEANLDKSDFVRSSLKKSVFCKTVLEETVFVACAINDINFDGVTLKGCGFKSTVFTNCNFTNTVFNKCKFKYTTFKNCTADKIAYNFLISSCRADVSGITII